MAPYSGSLQIKKKSELQDIAVALRISDKGTREELQLRIRKHLDDNQQLEDDPAFSGLFGKRKRSIQPQPATAVPRSVPSSTSEEVLVKSSESPKHTRSTRRFNALSIVRESTPVPDAREVSMMLKKAPVSPETSALQIETTQTPATRNADEVPLSAAPKSVLRVIPTPSVEHAFLPLQIIGVNNFHLFISYAPLATFGSPTFWTILIHWAIPTVVIPALAGSLVSFQPGNSPSARAPHTLYFDPLTASVIRVAVHYAYPYDTFKSRVECVDILGAQWRLLHASVVAALAFAEAIAVAPRAYAESKLRRTGAPKRLTMGEASQP
ncbi:hypothetical protein M404DRAFT_163595 [Pisolithus tinctorius Marx 270]|uniref:SAP domain-containing protein n=1 Tax=Pisolithus tinctorius Marx 270 TaxID=870435 RepID=A0A0C3NLV3_PISTI|nr:hypothetical protein M404DRAFT_163595 [Pisolithus tinctorius Marx 270]